jgi:phosphonate transport system substrate-binding protein
MEIATYNGLKKPAGAAFLLVAAVALLGLRPAAAADIRFAVQPILDAEATRKAYQPLADYLAEATGKTVELVITYDYAEYWQRMKRGRAFNLILDAPFYTDYRIREQGHVPLVKVPGVVSYSLVTKSGEAILDPAELIGKKIATIIPPAPGGLLMQKWFPNPSRQPYVMPAKSSEQALEMLLTGQVTAAMIPTPLAAQAMAQGKDIATVATSPQTPHITLTAGPDIDAATRGRIVEALLDAGKSPTGREMLKKIGFPEGFEPTSAEVYRGYSDYLKQQW